MSAVVLPLPEPPADDVAQARELLASAERHRDVVAAELDVVRHEPVDEDPLVVQFQSVHQEALAHTLGLWQLRVAQLNRRLSYLLYGR